MGRTQWLASSSCYQHHPFKSSRTQVGLGAHLGHQVISGEWQEHETCLHINVLEMRAVRQTGLQFKSRFRNRSVFDNVTVVAHINKQGDTHSALNERGTPAVPVQEQNMTLAEHHIVGPLNAVADLATRTNWCSIPSGSSTQALLRGSQSHQCGRANPLWTCLQTG